MSAARRRRVGVLISGRGSNMMALLTAARAADYPADIAVVLANREDAAGLALARAEGVPALAVPSARFGRDRAAHEVALAAELDRHEVELVCLAGYLRLLTPWFVDRYRGRMLNIHPSLLPAFPGLDTHARALAAGVKLHGCSVHLVSEGMDEGPILAQGAVPVLPGDDEVLLAARVLALEHRLYPAALRAFLTAAPHLPAAGAVFCNPLPTPGLAP
ncbi:MAG: phosphoribosylglycinamide formyltransferase [Acidibrevibacterium sp.]|uniref:phosphoribosylglycinamide formyltransferase n=1 Tax=Acidibrevibacterium sp. TaxID=2606776 RepID=UPI003D041009